MGASLLHPIPRSRSNGDTSRFPPHQNSEWPCPFREMHGEHACIQATSCLHDLIPESHTLSATL